MLIHVIIYYIIMKTKWNKNRYLSLLSCSTTLLVISPALLISCSNNNEKETTFSDQEIVNNYISSLKKPSIKPEKSNEKINTFAKDINTEEIVKSWFNDLPVSNGDVISSFISSTPAEGDKQTLIIKYDISRNNYHQVYQFQESGFKKVVDEPTEPSNPNELINFSISVKRSNGKKLPIYPTIQIYNENNVLVKEKFFYDDQDLPWEFQLENSTYKVKVRDMDNNVTWSYQSEYIINEKNNKLDIIFSTNKLYEKEKPATFSKYQKSMGIYKTDFTDVLGTKLSLADNCKNNKITLFVFFKTTCPYSRELLQIINNFYIDSRFKNKFEVWCFSSASTDSIDKLINFAQYEYPQYHIIADSNYTFRNQFENIEGTKIPRTVVVDSEGIYVEFVHGPSSEMIQNIFQTWI